MTEFTQVDIDNAVAAATQNHATAIATARTEGQAEGATAERTRINAILASDEGQARPKAALSAALKSGMDLDTATAFLAELAEEPKADAAAPGAGAPAGMFQAAMDGTANPGIEALGDDDDVVMSKVDGVFALRGKAKRAA